MSNAIHPEPIEVISHLHARHAMTWESLRGLSDFAILDLHDGEHDAPRSFNHHADEYPTDPPFRSA